MAVPRFFVDQLPISGIVELPSDEAKHAFGVLRLAVGQDVVLFDGRGGEALGTIASADRKRVAVSVVARPDTNRELWRPLRVFVSLPKGDRQRTLTEGLVQLGASELIPLESRRAVAQPTAGALQRLNRYVCEASKQCGRNTLMQIPAPCSLESLSEMSGDGIRLVCHPYQSSASLSELLPSLSAAVDISVAVGPEGGFTDEEIEQLVRTGWQTLSLGPRILRVEMAALAVVATVAQAIGAEP